MCPTVESYFERYSRFAMYKNNLAVGHEKCANVFLQ